MKQQPRWMPWLRGIALATLFFFVSTNIVQADMAKVLTSSSSAETSSYTKNSIRELLESISIPENLGQIKKSFRGNRDRLVIHIQDAHVNEEAQRNIALMLDYLAKNQGLKLVNIEGAEGDLYTQLFSFVPYPEARRKVSDYFLKEGRLSAAEYAAIADHPQLQLFGIENSKLYQENRQAFLEALEFKSRDEALLSKMDKILSDASRFVFSEGMRELLRRRAGFQEEGRELISYVGYLVQTAQTQNIAVHDYPRIHSLLALVDLEKQIDFEKAEKEIQQLTDDLKNILSREKLTEFLNNSVQFQMKKIRRSAYYGYLENEIKTADASPLQAKYQNVLNYLKYMQLYDAIDLEVFDEIHRLESALKNKMFRTPEEVKLDELLRIQEIYKNMFNFSLTKKDVEYYYQFRSQFVAATYEELLKPIFEKYKFSYRLPKDLNQLDQDLPRVEKFYKAAVQRDPVLIQNAVEKMEKENQKISVIITGGFHTPGIEDYLSGQDYSYLVITPKISSRIDAEKENKRYQEAMQHKPTAIEKTLSDAFFAPKSVMANDPRFQLAVDPMVRPITGGVRKALESTEARSFFSTEIILGIFEQQNALKVRSEVRQSLETLLVSDQEFLGERVDELTNALFHEENGIPEVVQNLPNGQKQIYRLTSQDANAGEINVGKNLLRVPLGDQILSSVVVSADQVIEPAKVLQPILQEQIAQRDNEVRQTMALVLDRFEEVFRGLKELSQKSEMTSGQIRKEVQGKEIPALYKQVMAMKSSILANPTDTSKSILSEIQKFENQVKQKRRTIDLMLEDSKREAEARKSKVEKAVSLQKVPPPSSSEGTTSLTILRDLVPFAVLKGGGTFWDILRTRDSVFTIFSSAIFGLGSSLQKAITATKRSQDSLPEARPLGNSVALTAPQPRLVENSRDESVEEVRRKSLDQINRLKQTKSWSEKTSMEQAAIVEFMTQVAIANYNEGLDLRDLPMTPKELWGGNPAEKAPFPKVVHDSKEIAETGMDYNYRALQFLTQELPKIGISLDEIAEVLVMELSDKKNQNSKIQNILLTNIAYDLGQAWKDEDEERIEDIHTVLANLPEKFKKTFQDLIGSSSPVNFNTLQQKAEGYLSRLQDETPIVAETPVAKALPAAKTYLGLPAASVEHKTKTKDNVITLPGPTSTILLPGATLESEVEKVLTEITQASDMPALKVIKKNLRSDLPDDLHERVNDALAEQEAKILNRKLDEIEAADQKSKVSDILLQIKNLDSNIKTNNDAMIHAAGTFDEKMDTLIAFHFKNEEAANAIERLKQGLEKLDPKSQVFAKTEDLFDKQLKIIIDEVNPETAIVRDDMETIRKLNDVDSGKYLTVIQNFKFSITDARERQRQRLDEAEKKISQVKDSKDINAIFEKFPDFELQPEVRLERDRIWAFAEKKLAEVRSEARIAKEKRPNTQRKLNVELLEPRQVLSTIPGFEKEAAVLPHEETSALIGSPVAGENLNAEGEDTPPASPDDQFVEPLDRLKNNFLLIAQALENDAEGKTSGFITSFLQNTALNDQGQLIFSSQVNAVADAPIVPLIAFIKQNPILENYLANIGLVQNGGTERIREALVGGNAVRNGVLTGEIFFRVHKNENGVLAFFYDADNNHILNDADKNPTAVPLSSVVEALQGLNNTAPATQTFVSFQLGRDRFGNELPENLKRLDQARLSGPPGESSGRLNNVLAHLDLQTLIEEHQYALKTGDVFSRPLTELSTILESFSDSQFDQDQVTKIIRFVERQTAALDLPTLGETPGTPGGGGGGTPGTPGTPSGGTSVGFAPTLPNLGMGNKTPGELGYDFRELDASSMWSLWATSTSPSGGSGGGSGVSTPQIVTGSNSAASLAEALPEPDYSWNPQEKKKIVQEESDLLSQSDKTPIPISIQGKKIGKVTVKKEGEKINLEVEINGEIIFDETLEPGQKMGIEVAALEDGEKVSVTILDAQKNPVKTAEVPVQNKEKEIYHDRAIEEISKEVPSKLSPEAEQAAAEAVAMQRSEARAEISRRDLLKFFSLGSVVAVTGGLPAVLAGQEISASQFETLKRLYEQFSGKSISENALKEAVAEIQNRSLQEPELHHGTQAELETLISNPKIREKLLGAGSELAAVYGLPLESKPDKQSYSALDWALALARIMTVLDIKDRGEIKGQSLEILFLDQLLTSVKDTEKWLDFESWLTPQELAKSVVAHTNQKDLTEAEVLKEIPKISNFQSNDEVPEMFRNFVGVIPISDWVQLNKLGAQAHPENNLKLDTRLGISLALAMARMKHEIETKSSRDKRRASDFWFEPQQFFKDIYLIRNRIGDKATFSNIQMVNVASRIRRELADGINSVLFSVMRGNLKNDLARRVAHLKQWLAGNATHTGPLYEPWQGQGANNSIPSAGEVATALTPGILQMALLWMQRHVPGTNRPPRNLEEIIATGDLDIFAAVHQALDQLVKDPSNLMTRMYALSDDPEIQKKMEMWEKGLFTVDLKTKNQKETQYILLEDLNKIDVSRLNWDGQALIERLKVKLQNAGERTSSRELLNEVRHDFLEFMLGLQAGRTISWVRYGFEEGLVKVVRDENGKVVYLNADGLKQRLATMVEILPYVEMFFGRKLNLNYTEDMGILSGMGENVIRLGVGADIFSPFLFFGATREGILNVTEAYLKNPSLAPAQKKHFQDLRAGVQAVPEKANLFEVQDEVAELLAALGYNKPFDLQNYETGSQQIGFLISWVMSRVDEGWDETADRAQYLIRILKSVEGGMPEIAAVVNQHYQALGKAIGYSFPVVPDKFEKMNAQQLGLLISFLLEIGDNGWEFQVKRSQAMIQRYFSVFEKDRSKLVDALREAKDYYDKFYQGNWDYAKSGLTVENIREDRKARGYFTEYLKIKYSMEPAGRSEVRDTKMTRRKFVKVSGAIAGSALIATSNANAQQSIANVGAAPAVGPTGPLNGQNPAFYAPGRAAPNATLITQNIGQNAPTPFRPLQVPIKEDPNEVEIDSKTTLQEIKEKFDSPNERKELFFDAFILFHIVNGNLSLDLNVPENLERVRQAFENNYAELNATLATNKRFAGFVQSWAKSRIDEGWEETRGRALRMAEVLTDPEKRETIFNEVQKLTDFRMGPGALNIRETLKSKAETQGLVIGWVQFRIGFYEDIDLSWEKTEGVADEVIKKLTAMENDPNSKLFYQTLGKLYFLDQTHLPDGEAEQQAAVKEIEQRAAEQVKGVDFFRDINNKKAMEFMTSMTAMLVVDFRQGDLNPDDNLGDSGRFAHHVANFWYAVTHLESDLKKYYQGINRGDESLDPLAERKNLRRKAWGDFAALVRMMEDIYSKYDLEEKELAQMDEVLRVQRAAKEKWETLEDAEIAYYYRLFYLGRRNGEILEGEQVAFSEIPGFPLNIEDFMELIDNFIKVRRKAGDNLLEKMKNQTPPWLNEADYQTMKDLIEGNSGKGIPEGLRDLSVLEEEAVSRVIQIFIEQKQMPPQQRKTKQQIEDNIFEIMQAELYLQSVYMTFHREIDGTPIRMPRGDLSPFLDSIENGIRTVEEIAKIFKYDGLIQTKLRDDFPDKIIKEVEALKGPLTDAEKASLLGKIFQLMRSQHFGKATFMKQQQDRKLLGKTSAEIEKYANDWISDAAFLEAVGYVHNVNEPVNQNGAQYPGYLMPYFILDSAVEQFRGGQPALTWANGKRAAAINYFKTMVQDVDLSYRNLGPRLNSLRLLRVAYFSIYQKSLPNEEEAWWLKQWGTLQDLAKKGNYRQGVIEMLEQEFIERMLTARSQLLEMIGPALYEQNPSVGNLEEVYAEAISRYENFVAQKIITNLIGNRERQERVQIRRDKVQAEEWALRPAQEKLAEDREKRKVDNKDLLGDAAARRGVMKSLQAKSPVPLSFSDTYFLIGKMKELGYTEEEAIERFITLPRVLAKEIFQKVNKDVDWNHEQGKITAMTDTIFKRWGYVEPAYQQQIKTQLAKRKQTNVTTVEEGIQDSLNDLEERLRLTKLVQDLYVKAAETDRKKMPETEEPFDEEKERRKLFGMASRIAADSLAGGLQAQDLIDWNDISMEIREIADSLGIDKKKLTDREIRFRTDLILRLGVSELYRKPAKTEIDALAIQDEIQKRFSDLLIPEQRSSLETMLESIIRARKIETHVAITLRDDPAKREKILQDLLEVMIHKNMSPYDLKALFEEAEMKYSHIQEMKKAQAEKGLYRPIYLEVPDITFWDVLIYLDMNRSDLMKRLNLDKILFVHQEEGKEVAGLPIDDLLRLLAKVELGLNGNSYLTEQNRFKKEVKRPDMNPIAKLLGFENLEENGLHKVSLMALILTAIVRLFGVGEMSEPSLTAIPKEQRATWRTFQLSLINGFVFKSLVAYGMFFLLVGGLSALFFFPHTHATIAIGIVFGLSFLLSFIIALVGVSLPVVFKRSMAILAIYGIGIGLFAMGPQALLSAILGLMAAYPALAFVAGVFLVHMGMTSSWFKSLKWVNNPDTLIKDEKIFEQLKAMKVLEKNPQIYDPRVPPLRFLKTVAMEQRPWLPGGDTYDGFMAKLDKVISGQFISWNGNFDENFKLVLELNGGLFNYDMEKDPSDDVVKPKFQILNKTALTFKKEIDPETKRPRVMTYGQLYEAIRLKYREVIGNAVEKARAQAEERGEKFEVNYDYLRYWKDQDGKLHSWNENLIVLVMPGARKPYHTGDRMLPFLMWEEDGTSGATWGEKEYEAKTASGEWKKEDFEPYIYYQDQRSEARNTDDKPRRFWAGLPFLVDRKMEEVKNDSEYNNLPLYSTDRANPFNSGVLNITDPNQGFIPWEEAKKLEHIQKFLPKEPGEEPSVESWSYIDDTNYFSPGGALYMFSVINKRKDLQDKVAYFQGSIGYFPPFEGLAADTLYSYTGWIAHIKMWFMQTIWAIVFGNFRMFGKYSGTVKNTAKVFRPLPGFYDGPYGMRLVPMGEFLYNRVTERNPNGSPVVNNAKDSLNAYGAARAYPNSEDEIVSATIRDTLAIWTWLRKYWDRYKKLEKAEGLTRWWGMLFIPKPPMSHAALVHGHAMLDKIASMENPPFPILTNALMEMPENRPIIIDDRSPSSKPEVEEKGPKWINNDAVSILKEIKMHLFALAPSSKFFAGLVQFAYGADILFGAYLIAYLFFGTTSGFIMVQYIFAAWTFTTLLLTVLIGVKFAAGILQRMEHLPVIVFKEKSIRIEGSTGAMLGLSNGLFAALEATVLVGLLAFFGFIGTVSVPFFTIVAVFSTAGVIVGYLKIPKSSEASFASVKFIKQLVLAPSIIFYSLLVDAPHIMAELILSGPLFMANLIVTPSMKVGGMIDALRRLIYGSSGDAPTAPNSEETETNPVWSYWYLVWPSVIFFAVAIPVIGFGVFSISPILLGVIGMVVGGYASYILFSTEKFNNMYDLIETNTRNARSVEARWYEAAIDNIQAKLQSKLPTQFYKPLRVAGLFFITVFNYFPSVIQGVRDLQKRLFLNILPDMTLKKRDWAYARFGRMVFFMALPAVLLPLIGFLAPITAFLIPMNTVLLAATILFAFGVAALVHFFSGIHFKEDNVIKIGNIYELRWQWKPSVVIPWLHWGIGAFSILLAVLVHLPGLQPYVVPVMESLKHMPIPIASYYSGGSTSMGIYGAAMNIFPLFVIFHTAILIGQIFIAGLSLIWSILHTASRLVRPLEGKNIEKQKADRTKDWAYTAFLVFMFILTPIMGFFGRIPKVSSESNEESEPTVVVQTDQEEIPLMKSNSFVPKVEKADSTVSKLSPDVEAFRNQLVKSQMEYFREGRGTIRVSFESNGQKHDALVPVDSIDIKGNPKSPVLTQPLVLGMWANILAHQRNLEEIEKFIGFLEYIQKQYERPIWFDIKGNELIPANREKEGIGIEDLNGYTGNLFVAQLELSMLAAQEKNDKRQTQINELIGRLGDLLKANKELYQSLIDPNTGLLYRNYDLQTGTPIKTYGFKDRRTVEDRAALAIAVALYNLPETVWTKAPFRTTTYTNPKGEKYLVIEGFNGAAFEQGYVHGMFGAIENRYPHMRTLNGNVAQMFMDSADQNTYFPTAVYRGNDYFGKIGGPVKESTEKIEGDVIVPAAGLMFASPDVLRDFKNRKFASSLANPALGGILYETGDPAASNRHSAILIGPSVLGLMNMEGHENLDNVLRQLHPELLETMKKIDFLYQPSQMGINVRQITPASAKTRSEVRPGIDTPGQEKLSGAGRSEVRSASQESSLPKLAAFISSEILQKRMVGEELSSEEEQAVLSAYPRFIAAIQEAAGFSPAIQSIQGASKFGEISEALRESGLFGDPDWRNLPIKGGAAWTFKEGQATFKLHQDKIIEAAEGIASQDKEILSRRMNPQALQENELIKVRNQIFPKIFELYQTLSEQERKIFEIALVAHDLGRLVSNGPRHPALGGEMVPALTHALGLSREDAALIKALTSQELAFGALPFGETSPKRLLENLEKLLGRNREAQRQFLKMMSLIYLADAGSVPRGSEKEIGQLTINNLTSALYLSDLENVENLKESWYLLRGQGLLQKQGVMDLSQIKVADDFVDFAGQHKAFLNAVSFQRAINAFRKMSSDKLLQFLELAATLYEDGLTEEQQITFMGFSTDQWPGLFEKIAESLKDLPSWKQMRQEGYHFDLARLSSEEGTLALRKNHKGLNFPIATAQVKLLGSHNLEILVDTWRNFPARSEVRPGIDTPGQEKLSGAGRSEVRSASLRPVEQVELRRNFLEAAKGSERWASGQEAVERMRVQELSLSEKEEELQKLGISLEKAIATFGPEVFQKYAVEFESAKNKDSGKILIAFDPDKGFGLDFIDAELTRLEAEDKDRNLTLTIFFKDAAQEQTLRQDPRIQKAQSEERLSLQRQQALISYLRGQTNVAYQGTKAIQLGVKAEHLQGALLGKLGEMALGRILMLGFGEKAIFENLTKVISHEEFLNEVLTRALAAARLTAQAA